MKSMFFVGEGDGLFGELAANDYRIGDNGDSGAARSIGQDSARNESNLPVYYGKSVLFRR